MKKKHNDISTTVMETIHEQSIQMKPHWYFVMGSFILFLSIFLIFFLTLLFLTVSLYRLRVGGPFDYLSLGPVGFIAFLRIFPLPYFALALLGIFLGIQLLKKYDFSYRKNFRFIMLGVIGALCLAAFIIDISGINDRLSRHQQLRSIYRDQMHSDQWVMGRVTFVVPPRLGVRTLDDNDVIIVWTEDTLLPFSSHFQVGQMVRAVGEWNGYEFVAEGIGGGRRGRGF